MRAFAIVLAVLLLSLVPTVVDDVEAQSATAAVDLTCTSPYNSGAIEIEVYPGATLTGYSICTVSNPSVHNEKISIQVQADGLASAAPGTINLAPGAEEDFQVTVRAESRMAMSSRVLTTTATVTEMNGVPPPNVAESTVNQIISIKQFSMLSVEMEESDVKVFTGGEVMLEYKVYNQGNGIDKFMFEADYDDNLEFQTSIPIVSAEIDSMSTPYRFRLNLKAPNDGSNWEVNSDGVKYYQTKIEVTVTSEFSCRSEGFCNSFTVLQSVTFLHNETVESESNLLSSATDEKMLIYGGGGAGLILLLLLVMVIRKRRN